MAGSIYHEMTEEDLQKQLGEARAEIRELRFSFAVVRSMQDPGKIGTLKRNIARILTVQEERKRGITEIKPKADRKKKDKKKKEKS